MGVALQLLTRAFGGAECAVRHGWRQQWLCRCWRRTGSVCHAAAGPNAPSAAPAAALPGGRRRRDARAFERCVRIASYGSARHGSSVGLCNRAALCDGRECGEERAACAVVESAEHDAQACGAPRAGNSQPRLGAERGQFAQEMWAVFRTHTFAYKISCVAGSARGHVCGALCLSDLSAPPQVPVRR